MARDVMILDGILNNLFILQMVIHFVWCSNTGISEYITDPLEDFNTVFAAIGAVMKLILFKQMLHPPVTIAHSQLNSLLGLSHCTGPLKEFPLTSHRINIQDLALIFDSKNQKHIWSEHLNCEAKGNGEGRGPDDGLVQRIWIGSEIRMSGTLPGNMVYDKEPKKQHNLPAQKKPHMDTTTKGVTHPAILQALARKCRDKHGCYYALTKFHIDEGSTSSVKHGSPPKKAQKETKQQPTSHHASKDMPSSINNAFLADEPESDYQPSCDSEADAEEIDDNSEEPKSVMKFLSAEVPTFVLISEAERLDFPLTQPTWPHAAASKLTRKTELFLSQPSTPVATKPKQGLLWLPGQNPSPCMIKPGQRLILHMIINEKMRHQLEQMIPMMESLHQTTGRDSRLCQMTTMTPSLQRTTSW
ncbi:hypothetical protein DFH29DRAFT_880251 [Suillus ampliporus]|nr:hypothetical protein DFH29DRAFT_880251 [Suillus ampliporus]